MSVQAGLLTEVSGLLAETKKGGSHSGSGQSLRYGRGKTAGGILSF
ncbi:hypothetical protein LAJLEIBI_03019 [[Clostridium] hylemonae DSM 15053]|nr:hypothetical protein LAJLEIBI_03019 [[Clostridium] hylemonae DSM 15053]